MSNKITFEYMKNLQIGKMKLCIACMSKLLLRNSVYKCTEIRNTPSCEKKFLF